MPRNKHIKIMFMGTPEFAEEVLRSVYSKEGCEVCAVVTRPDKPAGRGMKMLSSPVKKFALEHDIPVYQPATLKDGRFIDVLDEIKPELIIVAAYGNILPEYVIEYPEYGCINAHGSLLPKYRGAAPMQRALMEGEKVTGITAMYMDKGLDTGDMILKLECPVTDEDDFGTIHDKLASLGGKAMCDVIDMIWKGEVPREKQNDSESTYASKIEKSETYLDFTRPADEIFNKIRGLSPAPCAATTNADGTLLKIIKAKKSERPDAETYLPGEVVETDMKGDGYFTVRCGDGFIDVTFVQPQGKRAMSSADYLRGRKIVTGQILGEK